MVLNTQSYMLEGLDGWISEWTWRCWLLERKWPSLHQCFGVYPRNTEERWWKPIKTPSIQVSKKILYCHLVRVTDIWRFKHIFSEAKDTKICMSHLPLSPTKERMSSNVLALVAILNNNIQDDQAQKNPLTNLYLHHSWNISIFYFISKE